MVGVKNRLKSAERNGCPEFGNNPKGAEKLQTNKIEAVSLPPLLFYIKVKEAN